MQLVTSIATYFLLERPPRHFTTADFVRELEKGKTAVLARAQQVGASADNQRVLSHIIGIERWGQARIKVAQGAPFIQEEYNGYRPTRETPWTDLIEQFAATRQATIALVQALTPSHYEQCILHNQWGKLSVRAWLRYLTFHATTESRRLKA